MKRITFFAVIGGSLIVVGGIGWMLLGSRPASVRVATPPPEAPAPTQNAQIYALSDIAIHGTSQDCWFAVNGSVYNLTDYIAKGRHKAGIEAIIPNCGKDATQAFAQAHGTGRKGTKASNELNTFLIGTLKR